MQQGFLIFHSVAEGFSVLVACGIFVIAWNCREYMRNSCLLFIGIAFLPVGLVDLLHTLTYKGMGVFPSHGADLPTQLWIIGRFLESVALLIAPLLLNRPLRPLITLAVCLGVASLLVALTFMDLFPVCFVEDSGLTPFKRVSEYIISGILAAAGWALFKKRHAFEPVTARLLIAAIAATILSELLFTFYVSVYGIPNILGHIFKIASVYLIYRAVIRTGLQSPFRLIFLAMKRSEGELRDANEMLRRQTEELEKANRGLEAFGHTVAHDLKAPLSTIKGFSQILGSYLDSGDRELLLECTESINMASDRMARLIKSLLDLAKIRHSPLSRTRVDLSAVAQEIADDLHHAEPEREVEFVIQPDITAECDPDLLRVALENLMGNAWKFTAGKEHARIEFSYDRVDDQDVYSIRDNGIGFDMAEAGEIFRAFERLPSAHDFQGTGIGLASVQRIIERHGGEIWAEGESDKGAAFHFTL